MGLAGAASESFDGVRIGPPPDIPSLLLNNRIVYLGMPITASVSELIVAEFLYLQYESEVKPCYVYINSPGTITEGRRLVGLDTEGFAIVDTMSYIKCPVNTICVGKAYGFAALVLASGDKGKRAAMPYASVMLQQPVSGAQGQASDIQISAVEALYNRKQQFQMLAAATGKNYAQVEKDASRSFYMDANQAMEYGIVDKIMERDQVSNMDAIQQVAPNPMARGIS